MNGFVLQKRGIAFSACGRTERALCRAEPEDALLNAWDEGGRLALFCKTRTAPGARGPIVERLFEQIEQARCCAESEYARSNDGRTKLEWLCFAKKRSLQKLLNSPTGFGKRLRRLLSNRRIAVLRRQPELFHRRCAIARQ